MRCLFLFCINMYSGFRDLLVMAVFVNSSMVAVGFSLPNDVIDSDFCIYDVHLFVRPVI